jgi:osmotically inducible lipoprotein OsmB
MKKTLLTLATLLLITTLSTACTNQDVGMVGGGVVGGAAGAALTHGSPIGAVVGAVGGGYVGSKLAQ